MALGCGCTDKRNVIRENKVLLGLKKLGVYTFYRLNEGWDLQEEKFFKFVILCLYTPLLQVRCWEVQDNGQTIPKAQQMHTGPVLDGCWSDVSSSLKINNQLLSNL